MRLLILGGTVFLGKHIAEAALAAGHTVTLFNRGRTNADTFAGRAGVETIHGDRDGGLAALGTGTWDAVVDTSGYLPRVVGQSAHALAGRVERYLFISTISVYADPPPAGVHEDSPLASLADPSVELVNGETYGGLKVLCEAAVRAAQGARALIVRPGLIVGPDDPTDRFSYWPLRAARGGRILAPGRPDAPTQLIDVRDLAAWTIRLLAAGRTGVFNATGPAAPIGLGELLETCLRAVGGDGELVWLDEAFLLEQGVVPFTELPCWVPSAGEGLLRTAIDRALAADLQLRPLEETARDTLAWRQPLVAARPLRAGLDAEREAALLAGADAG
ncbi:NAD-dependent epimerase/dehydratase family protein [bacterium]|nr:NAD-dependent epimerase/dehydratase family protein [bacterium]